MNKSVKSNVMGDVKDTMWAMASRCISQEVMEETWLYYDLETADCVNELNEIAFMLLILK